MRNRVLGVVAVLLVAGGCSLWAQDASPQFEVASVKPAAPQAGRGMMRGMRGGPGTPDPTRITYTNATLTMLLTMAYNVKRYQITAPAWFDSEGYDITAKIPEGTPMAQFRVMLQNLLAERFKVVLHKESKELPSYNLVVAKGGPKLKESVIDPNAPASPAPPLNGLAALPPPPPPPPGGALGGVMTYSGGGRGGPPLPGGRGPGMMMEFNEGRMRLRAMQQSAQGIADMLTNQLGRPVFDKTGLTGKYDYELEFAPEPGQGMIRMGPPGPPGEGGGPAPGASDPNGPPGIVSAVSQLGLKLEPSKNQVEIIIVEKGEKVPVEN